MEIPVDKKLIQRFSEILERRKSLPTPKGEKHGPYYNERTGKLVKSWLDSMVESNAPMKLLPESGAVNTIRMQYYQGAKYLRDHLDSNEHYANLIALTACVKYRDYCELHFRATPICREQVITSAPTASNWKDKLMDYLESASSNQKFHEKGVFSASDLNWVSTQLVDVSSLFYPPRLEKTMILIIKK